MASSSTAWMGYLPPWGTPFLPAWNPWVPLNAVGVLGPCPGLPTQAYTIMPPGDTAPPPTYPAVPYSFDHTAMLHQAIEWIVDSGASSHVTGKTGNLTSSHSNLGTNSQHIIVGNGSKLPVFAMGSVQISNLPLYLQNVLVSPSIVKNLISV
jgi:hypothetical protein